jgi:hypothetical protein
MLSRELLVLMAPMGYVVQEEVVVEEQTPLEQIWWGALVALVDIPAAVAVVAVRQTELLQWVVLVVLELPG